MKKKKNFMQNEANLEKVAGGLSGVEVETDVELNVELEINNDDHSKHVDLSGGFSGSIGSGGFNIKQ